MKTSRDAVWLSLLMKSIEEVTTGLRCQQPAGGDSTGFKKKSDCIEAYEQMTQLQTHLTSDYKRPKRYGLFLC